MSSALEHELEAAERELSSDAQPVAHQGPKLREDAGTPIPQPTPASEWKRDLPETHTLPSGNTATLRRPRTLEMIRKGEIPNPLLDVALEAAAGKRPADPATAIDFLDFMVAQAFVEPKVAIDEPGPGELSISDLSDADKNYVLIWVQRGVAGLASFRSLGEGAPPGSDGRGVRDEAE